MYGALGRVHCFAWTKIARSRTNRVAEFALKHIDTLFVSGMTVGRGYVRPWGNRQFKDAQAVCG